MDILSYLEIQRSSNGEVLIKQETLKFKSIWELLWGICDWITAQSV